MNKKNKNLILLVLMIAAIGLTVFLLLQKNGGSDVKTIEDSVLLDAPAPRIPQGLSEEIFSSDDFKKLEDFSDKNLEVDKKGRVNPFEPFQISIE